MWAFLGNLSQLPAHPSYDVTQLTPWRNKCVVRARHDNVCGHLSFKCHSRSCSTQWRMHCAQRSAVSQHITWTNVDWSSVESSGIHIRAISQKLRQPAITKIRLKISFKFPRGQWVNVYTAHGIFLSPWNFGTVEIKDILSETIINSNITKWHLPRTSTSVLGKWDFIRFCFKMFRQILPRSYNVDMSFWRWIVTRDYHFANYCGLIYMLVRIYIYLNYFSSAQVIPIWSRWSSPFPMNQPGPVFTKW